MNRKSSFLVLSLGIFLITSIAAYSQTAPAVNLTGKWVFQVESAYGTGTPAIEFKQDGEKLTGHIAGPNFEADFTGTVKGQAFDFSFTRTVQGFTLNVTYTGTIENKDSMKGTVVFGEFGEGTFTGKRQ